jgi:membrane-associated phospholipid phosphatase
MDQIFNNTIKIIGEHGPTILFVETIYLLWNKSYSLMYYSYGFFLSLILNVVLKGIFQQPRPSEDPKLFNIALKNGTRFKFINGIPHDIFGMPSGHAQAVIFTTLFIHLTLKNRYLTSSFLIISLLTMYQRVKYDYHTVFQVIAGAIVGALFAYFIHYMSYKKIIGKIMSKKDDNTFI